MKCPHCGNEIEAGGILCPFCSHEIEILQDYESADSLFHKADIDRNRKEEAERKNDRYRKARKRRKRKIAVIAILLIIVALLGAAAAFFYINYQHQNSYDYQYQKAQTSRVSGNTADAESYVRRALYLSPSSREALRLYALILEDQERYEDAEVVYRQLTDSDDASEEDYRSLLNLLEKEDKTEEMQKLLADAPDEIQTIFASYLPGELSFQTNPGNYDECLTVYLNVKKGSQVYYTTDGTDPDENSLLYTEDGIETVIGKNEIRAVAISKYGISSDIISGTFTINSTLSDIPVISPASGTYKKGQKITVIVPSGCTAYYCFDALPGEKGVKYTGPVMMPAGTHTFMVQLRDKEGRCSSVTSETYMAQG